MLNDILKLKYDLKILFFSFSSKYEPYFKKIDKIITLYKRIELFWFLQPKFKIKIFEDT